MKVDGISITHVRVPLVEPFRISSGEVSLKDGIVVGVSSEGLVGFGEASPMAGTFYSSDTPESVWEILVSTMIPGVLAARVDSIDMVNRVLDRIPGSPFAKAGIETAFWDLTAQIEEKPVFEILGGKNRPLESGLAVGIYPHVDDLVGAIDRHMAEGYRRIKIKIQPGWDMGPLEAVRKRFDDVPLMVDANCAYTEKHITHLKNLDEFGLTMVEQPMGRSDLAGHALLQKQLKTPVCLDESAEDLESVQRAIGMGACKIVNIKIQRVGGLKKAKEIHDVCGRAGVPVWGGTMPELGIGGAQTLHLATLPNFTYPTDVESSLRWFVDDIVHPLLRVERGTFLIPKGSGNCYHVDSRAVKKYTIAEQQFHA
jgi:O-succinylbenzoate synthase